MCVCVCVCVCVIFHKLGNLRKDYRNNNSSLYIHILPTCLYIFIVNGCIVTIYLYMMTRELATPHSINPPPLLRIISLSFPLTFCPPEPLFPPLFLFQHALRNLYLLYTHALHYRPTHLHMINFAEYI